MREDEMVVWYHRLDRHEFEQALGVGAGQGSLVCCSSQGHKESDTTEATKHVHTLMFPTELRRKSLFSHSVQFIHSVMSDSLRLDGLQHARLPCPPTPRAGSNSCPLSW